MPKAARMMCDAILVTSYVIWGSSYSCPATEMKKGIDCEKEAMKL